MAFPILFLHNFMDLTCCMYPGHPKQVFGDIHRFKLLVSTNQSRLTVSNDRLSLIGLSYLITAERPYFSLYSGRKCSYE